MRPKVISILIFVWLFFWCAPSSIAGAAAPVDSAGIRAIYVSCLEAMIARCEAKAPLKTSRSAAIRREAARYCLKVDFIRSHRRQLLAKMMTAGVKPTASRIEYFVNHYFHAELDAAARSIHVARTDILAREE